MALKIHVVRKLDTPRWKTILIKVSSVILAFLVSALFASIIQPGAFADFFKQMINGTFVNPVTHKLEEGLILSLFEVVAILALIAIALTPCFKMRFWNIGAEGQMMAGVIATALIMKYLGPVMPRPALIVTYIVASIVAGGLFGFLPAVFKAYFKTNETLFTLMLNYVATFLAAYIIYTWDPKKGTVPPFNEKYYIPDLFNKPYLVIIIFAALLAIAMFIYLRFSKHGYELSVVGESQRTAKYIGINRKAVIIRTVVVSSALCGLIGCLMLAATNSSFTSSITGGDGFTGVLISWLGHFNPFEILIYAFLFGFVNKGSKAAAAVYGVGGSFTKIVSGIFFFFIIATEFFSNYKIVINKEEKHDDKVTNEPVSAKVETKEMEVSK